ncbi:anti-sigma factor [Oceanobacillus bengalensis]|uniref:Anti-sigma-W factor RsiW n=1 Tax=Oceanobacillus bengalensis TaxID=1435466 RepID=A0A494YT08_9BACI|nr:anti-sigma factor [Oceanobacillus bengalensis]
METHNKMIELMHRHLDGDLKKEEEVILRTHLEECVSCQHHFHDLKRTISLLKSVETIEAPINFTENVMAKLGAEKKHFKYKRWFKTHPLITAAAIFFIFMLSGAFVQFEGQSELVVSKQENLIVKGDTVIVPEGVTVEGDLLVKNGNLIIDGTVDGNVTIVNGELIDDDPLEGEGLMASVGEINGELNTVNKMFEWLWFQAKSLFKGVFSF